MRKIFPVNRSDVELAAMPFSGWCCGGSSIDNSVTERYYSFETKVIVLGLCIRVTKT